MNNFSSIRFTCSLGSCSRPLNTSLRTQSMRDFISRLCSTTTNLLWDKFLDRFRGFWFLFDFRFWFLFDDWFWFTTRILCDELLHHHFTQLQIRRFVRGYVDTNETRHQRWVTYEFNCASSRCCPTTADYITTLGIGMNVGTGTRANNSIRQTVTW